MEARRQREEQAQKKRERQQKKRGDRDHRGNTAAPERGLDKGLGLAMRPMTHCE